MKQMIYGTVLMMIALGSARAAEYEQRIDRSKTKARSEQAEPAEKPNTIKGEKVDVSGVIPHIPKSGLNLINPLAGPQHGDGRENVSKNVITGEASGLKFLSFEL